MQKELMPGCRISLRPVSFHADNDINAIHEWLCEGCAEVERVFWVVRLL